MKVLHDLVAGLDVHRHTVVACVRSPGRGRTRRAETREFETFIDDLERHDSAWQAKPTTPRI